MNERKAKIMARIFTDTVECLLLAIALIFLVEDWKKACAAAFCVQWLFNVIRRERE